jgi:hypothetical protein
MVPSGGTCSNYDVDYSPEALFPVLKILDRQWRSKFVCVCVGSLNKYANHSCFLLHSSHKDVNFCFTPSGTTRPRQRLTGSMTVPWSLAFLYLNFFSAVSIQPWYVRINPVSAVTEWTARQVLMCMVKLFLFTVVPTQPPIQYEMGSLSGDTATRS